MIEVIHPGVMSSVQDGGRLGYVHVGVPRSGAFDQVAFRTGNRLIGNTETNAAIEMTMSGGEFKFSSSAVICLTGAVSDESYIVYDSEKVPIHSRQPTVVPRDGTLKIGRFVQGFRGYLCVAGGIRCVPILGSQSSLVSLPDAGLGCALRSGDLLPIGASNINSGNDTRVSNSLEDHMTPDGDLVLRVVPGAQYDLFTEAQREALGELIFQVSDESSRAGARLSESVLSGEMPINISSEGALPGYIQVPPSGAPIILGIDGPTTGGYPVIASVIEADLPVLAQCALRQQLRFRWISREEAQQALREQYRLIQSVKPVHSVQIGMGIHRPNWPRVILSCDTGEAKAGDGRDQEMALLPHVSAVSIACGGHAGDEESIRELITAACAHDCIIGAHPSYPDREGFGRRAIEISREDLGSSLKNQLMTFSRIADECNATVSYIKAHGALYHALARDTSIARWYWEICTSIFPHVQFVGPMSSATLDDFKSSGIPVLCEGFCDRVYEADGTLRLRSSENACITNPNTAVMQAQHLVNEMGCQFLCVHSDTANAIEIARSVFEKLCVPKAVE